MFKCDYCGRELKSKAGLVRHESSCLQKNTEKEDNIVTLNDLIEELESKEVVQVEVVGEDNYYVGHPRRLIKLEGLLSRTFAEGERNKIRAMIAELRNAN